VTAYTRNVYRVSAQVALWIRVDELSDTHPLEQRLGGADIARVAEGPASQPPSDPAATARELTTQIARLNTQIRTALRQASEERDSETTGAEGASDEGQGGTTVRRLRAQRNRLVARLSGLGSPGSRVEAMSGASPDDRFVRGGIIPASVEIERNGFREADTARVDIAWADVPFDPRLVRACGIEVILGAVSADDFQAGVRGERRASGGLRSIVEQIPAGPVSQTATRFVGWVDDWTVSYDPDDGEIVTMEARDMTALLIDTPLGNNRIDLLVPVDVGVTRLLEQYPTAAGLRVVWGDVSDPTPGQAPTPGDAVPAVSRARRGRVARQPRSGDQRMTVWDHITDVCVQCGVVPLVRDYELRLINPRTLFTGRGPTGASQPRRMIYGRNLTSLQFTRKLGGVKVPTIEVRAYDPTIGRTRWARWPVREGERREGVLGQDNPPAALRANEVGPTGANPDERVQTFTVRYGGSPGALASIARSLYEQIGRQEIEGNFKTSDLRSFGSEEDASDLLSLLSGDPVEILVAAADRSDPTSAPSTATTIQAQTREARARYLQSLGWSADVAERFAELQDASGFQTVFRVQNARISFDAEEGISIVVDFVNFIVVREDEAAPQETATRRRVPSRAVDQATAGRTDTAAQDARRASADRRARTPDDPEIPAAMEEERARLRDVTISEDGPVLDVPFLRGGGS